MLGPFLSMDAVTVHLGDGARGCVPEAWPARLTQCLAPAVCFATHRQPLQRPDLKDQILIDDTDLDMLYVGGTRPRSESG